MKQDCSTQVTRTMSGGTPGGPTCPETLPSESPSEESGFIQTIIQVPQLYNYSLNGQYIITFFSAAPYLMSAQILMISLAQFFMPAVLPDPTGIQTQTSRMVGIRSSTFNLSVTFSCRLKTMQHTHKIINKWI